MPLAPLSDSDSVMSIFPITEISSLDPGEGMNRAGPHIPVLSTIVSDFTDSHQETLAIFLDTL